jgi:hypothetical protein
VTRRVAWIKSPGVDLAVAFAWVPFALVAHAVAHDANRIGAVAGGVLALSFAHQPVTLPLAYGEPGQRAAHRRLFAWTPIIAFAAIFAGLHLTLLGVAVIATLWNAHHTMRQRYGLVRIYGRKVGQQDGTLEQAMLFSWFGFALAGALASPALEKGIGDLPLGSVNGRAVEVLATARPIATVLLVIVGLVAAAITLRWVARERARDVVNPAKYVYLVGTAALFAAVFIDPVAGLLAYVGAHAVEYLIVVHGALGTRYGGDRATTLGRMVRSPVGRSGFLAGFVGLVLVSLSVIDGYLPELVFKSAYLTFGVLHFVYDGVIWKFRAPAAAAEPAIAVAA